MHSSCSRMAQQYIACSLDGCQKRSFSCARLSFCSEAVSAVFNNIASVTCRRFCQSQWAQFTGWKKKAMGTVMRLDIKPGGAKNKPTAI